MLPGNQVLLERGAIPLDREVFSSNTSLQDRLGAAQSGALFHETPMKSNGANRAQHPETSAKEAPSHRDLFEIVWPYVAAALREPRTPEELASLFNVKKLQKDVRKLGRPVRYVIDSQRSLPL